MMKTVKTEEILGAGTVCAAAGRALAIEAYNMLAKHKLPAYSLLVTLTYALVITSKVLVQDQEQVVSPADRLKVLQNLLSTIHAGIDNDETKMPPVTGKGGDA